jgi:ferredoxin
MNKGNGVPISRKKVLYREVIMKSIRKIIRIDAEKCNGCGLCVPSCAEGAIRIVDGKAQLVAEKYCDGLGACLGECPEGALQVVDAEVEAFDESIAVMEVPCCQGLPVIVRKGMALAGKNIPLSVVTISARGEIL